MSKPLVFVLGANPSWQSTLHFPKFIPGKVNRAVSKQDYSSGKGVNFCRAAGCFGAAETLLFQFAGGMNGRLHCDGLRELGISNVTIPVEANTRRCITCIDDGTGEMSELIEPSVALSAAEESAMLDEIGKRLSDASVFAVTGSLPDKSDPSLYPRAVALAVSRRIPVVIDAVAGVHESLKLDGNITVKINMEEFLKITASSSFREAAERVMREFPGKLFAITDGPDCAYLIRDGKITEYKVPSVEHLVSPLGCGDTASAVYSSCLAVGVEPEEAFRRALAAASANCLNDVAGNFSLADYQRLLG